ncbi:hypothetical protein Pve01_70260 [Planomonospora venezuelensis]|nr:hypothetical protein Pve01_70260 [Planomonospora venezuelensis]
MEGAASAGVAATVRAEKVRAVASADAATGRKLNRDTSDSIHGSTQGGPAQGSSCMPKTCHGPPDPARG